MANDVLHMTVETESSFGIVYAGKNLELQNKQLADSVLSAQIFLVQEILNLLYVKMAADQAKARRLNDQLTLEQAIARNVKNPDSDAKNVHEIVTFDGSGTAPFEGWILFAGPNNTVDTSYDNHSQATWAVRKHATHEASGMRYQDLIDKGATIWIPGPSPMISGKQVFQYYEKEADRLKAAISSLTSLASQDNYTVQTRNNTVSEVTTLMSTLEQKRHALVESVQQNIGR